jgi:site-specific recombinase
MPGRMKNRHDLPELLEALNPQAELVQRHLWLIALFEWLRGDCRSVPASIARVGLFLDAVQARPELMARVRVWWQILLGTVDGTTLLADYGFSSRSAFISEFAERVRQKMLPGTPETAPPPCSPWCCATGLMPSGWRRLTSPR